MPNEFAINITKIRDQARQHLKQGPVTQFNTMDVNRVITVLNEVVATEMVCYLRYTQNAIVAQGIDHGQVADQRGDPGADLPVPRCGPRRCVPCQIGCGGSYPLVTWSGAELSSPRS